MTHDAEALMRLLPDLQKLARILAPDRDSADDLMQDALLQVLRQIDRGAPIGALRPYVMTTLRNASRRPCQRDTPLDQAPPVATPGAALPRIACAEVLAAIDRLPPEQAVLLRAWLDGADSYAALAQRMHLPVGTVTSRLARARARLRAEFDLPDGGAVQALVEPDPAPATSR
ncbi:RNA polymerase sigma factor [Actibacterium ureilyticum]|uniref:RNA polymerase sigma factor n=1 Tax=Actibacterium ureilyticum TaxID=1590614 RepID=UPI001595945C|nr:RNA polymerase sigma factor [Actibacterium ureilyticum]